MYYLIVAATNAEIAPFLAYVQQQNIAISTHNNVSHFAIGNTHVDVLVTGPGLTHTAYYVAQQLSKKVYVAAINVGIAGAFNKNITIGKLVHITSEQFGDLGIDDNGTFIPLHQMPFVNANAFPYENGILYNKKPYCANLLQEIIPVSAISVNKVAGSAAYIHTLQQHFHPDTESMEGAAFFYACLQHELPFVQVRAISNHVTVRNRAAWNIPLALKQITIFLQKWLKTYC